VTVLPSSSYRPVFEESFDDVCRHLELLSARLFELLPDVSLGPDERLERLARVVPASVLVSRHHQNARSKLEQLRRRLAELVPGEELDEHQRLEMLVARVHELVPTEEPRLYRKLEALGDHRRSDTGRPCCCEPCATARRISG
jgi:hypothetical protein